ncbi:hypothetical protein ABZX75_25470 [Streptomyces sp. NPDC003038]|uniref:hypothetical protein n=1 Tax=unclassified Streptomyces TaxID=2593676 RepID=UPI0033BD4056
MFDLFRSETVICSFCKARPEDGGVRTLWVEQGSVSVTWHTAACPHSIADRILAQDKT